MAAAVGRVYGRFGRTFQHLFKLSNGKESLVQHVGKGKIHSSACILGTIKLDMPSLSPTMEKGNIVKWHKKEGDTISPGDVLCDIETDKAVIAMDTEEEGILAKIIVPENTKDVSVGKLIALMVEEGDDWKNVEIPADAKAAATAPTEAAAAPAASATGADHGIGDGHLVGPSVKKLLQEYNITSSDVKASGPGGALLKGDVLEHIKRANLPKVAQQATAPPSAASPTATPAPPQPAAVSQPPPAVAGSNFVDIPLTNMRRTIAKRLSESKATIPHAYASIDSSMGAATELRKLLAAEGVKVSVNDFIIKAAAMALQRVPQVNAIWADDKPQLASTVDISVAVATPNGLITPIVKGAAHLTVDQIGTTVKELAGRAREGKLQLHEFQGGSFSISNLGMFGITEFTAVINPPQLAIMAVGTSRPEASPSGNLHKMTVTLSYDSRAIHEVEATRFLEEFRHVLENPQTMLSGTGLDAAAEAFAF